jgi:hypothetical protein
VENRIRFRVGDARIATGLTQSLSVPGLGDSVGVHNLWIDLWTAVGARGEIL